MIFVALVFLCRQQINLNNKFKILKKINNVFTLIVLLLKLYTGNVMLNCVIYNAVCKCFTKTNIVLIICSKNIREYFIHKLYKTHDL